MIYVCKGHELCESCYLRSQRSRALYKRAEGTCAYCGTREFATKDEGLLYLVGELQRVAAEKEAELVRLRNALLDQESDWS